VLSPVRDILTDVGVEENAETSGVHWAKLGKVIDDRVDDDPKITLFVVLQVSQDAPILTGRG
jgi:hypothetical protein